MKEIKLSRGLFAIVDDDDYDKLNQHKWHAIPNGKTFYAIRYGTVLKDGKLMQRNVLMHRDILNIPIGKVTDHINRNGLDNRKENLRIVTQLENTWNRVDNNKYPGVYKSLNKFCASTNIGGVKNQYLGTFATAEEAHGAYMEKVIDHFKSKLP